MLTLAVDNTRAPTLTSMGFLVADQQCGVYRLQRYEGPHDVLSFTGVGLFFSPLPIKEARVVYFFEADATDSRDNPAALDALVGNWGDLDARRLGESGICGIKIDAAHFGHYLKDVTLERPRDGRYRHAALMSSGELICYD